MAETMRIDHAMHGFEPQSKRIKTDHERDGEKSPASYKSPYQYGHDRPPFKQGNGPASGVTGTPEYAYANRPPPPPTPGQYQYPIPYTSPGPVSQPAQHSPLANGMTIPPIRLPGDPRSVAASGTESNAHSQIAPNVYRPNFAHAPREPVALIWWFAQEISKISASKTNFYPNSQPTTPQSYIMPPVSYHEADAAAEKERQRLENRGRKQRWRQDNPERNKDNDLRCRVNKIAKNKFGLEDSPAKDAFIESEFNLRRAKREQRNKKNAAQSGTLPAFSSTVEGMTGDLQNALESSIDPGVETAGHELVGMLLEVPPAARRYSGTSSHLTTSIKRAEKFIEQMQSGTAKLDKTAKAMEVLADDANFVRALYAGLSERNTSTDYLSASGDDSPRATSQAPSTGMGVPGMLIGGAPPGFSDSHSTAAILSSLGGSKSYASPYDQPSSSKTSTTPSNDSEVKGTTPSVENSKSADKSSQNTTTRPIEKSNIDALLELANGGSLSDDEDEDDYRTAETRVNLAHHNGDTQMHDADEVRDEREEDLRRRYAESTVNTIVPVAKAHAASRMGQSTLSGIKPADRLDASQTSSKLVDSKSKTTYEEEEQRKIRIFGFPPKLRVKSSK